jgi:hypothetical protein
LEFQTPSNSKTQKLDALLTEASSCSVVITHPHEDHRNLHGVVLNMLNAKSPQCRTDLCDSWAESWEASYAKLQNALGNLVQVIPIKPDAWPGEAVLVDAHDFNCMIKLKFKGRSILFTGDVSPQLFTSMMSDPRYYHELTNVDFLVLPHHGSNESGELMVFYAIRPEMCIACSNPAEGHCKMPWAVVGQLQFSTDKPCDVASHRISTAEEVYEDSQLPVFVTCDSSMFYSLKIFVDGEAQMVDGFSEDPCFFSTFSEGKLTRYLVGEMHQLYAECMAAYGSAQPNSVAQLLFWSHWPYVSNMKQDILDHICTESCEFGFILGILHHEFSQEAISKIIDAGKINWVVRTLANMIALHHDNGALVTNVIQLLRQIIKANNLDVKFLVDTMEALTIDMLPVAELVTLTYQSWGAQEPPMHTHVDVFQVGKMLELFTEHFQDSDMARFQTITSQLFPEISEAVMQVVQDNAQLAALMVASIAYCNQMHNYAELCSIVSADTWNPRLLSLMQFLRPDLAIGVLTGRMYHGDVASFPGLTAAIKEIVIINPRYAPYTMELLAPLITEKTLQPLESIILTAYSAWKESAMSETVDQVAKMIDAIAKRDPDNTLVGDFQELRSKMDQ